MPRNAFTDNPDIVIVHGARVRCRSCGCTYTGHNIHTCETCVDCCQCVPCSRCSSGIGQGPICDSCEGCARCCSCPRCQHCHHTNIDGAAGICPFCGRGFACGCCRRQGNIHFVKRALDLDKWACRTQAEQGDALSRRLIGAEIEVCGTRPGTLVDGAIQQWKGTVVSDGSLPAGGYEINTHPSAGSYYVEQVTDIYKALNISGLWMDSHAGCHIHVDARDFDYTDLYKLLCVYAVLEPGLYKLIPQNRRASRYCIPCGPRYYGRIHTTLAQLNKSERNPIKSAILLSVYGSRDTREHKKDKNHETRYRSLNVHSYTFRGTIEFRMPEGTVYAENVINYGMLYAYLMDTAKKLSVKDAKDYAQPFMKRWGVEEAAETGCGCPAWSATYGEIPATVKNESLAALIDFYKKTPAPFRAWLDGKLARPEIQARSLTPTLNQVESTRITLSVSQYPPVPPSRRRPPLWVDPLGVQSLRLEPGAVLEGEEMDSEGER